MLTFMHCAVLTPHPAQITATAVYGTGIVLSIVPVVSHVLSSEMPLRHPQVPCFTFVSQKINE
jgi:hypothetical protein